MTVALTRHQDLTFALFIFSLITTHTHTHMERTDEVENEEKSHDYKERNLGVDISMR